MGFWAMGFGVWGLGPPEKFIFILKQPHFVKACHLCPIRQVEAARQSRRSASRNVAP
jgi:hypothetical protein